METIGLYTVHIVSIYIVYIYITEWGIYRVSSLHRHRQNLFHPFCNLSGWPGSVELTQEHLLKLGPQTSATFNPILVKACTCFRPAFNGLHFFCRLDQQATLLREIQYLYRQAASSSLVVFLSFHLEKTVDCSNIKSLVFSMVKALMASTAERFGEITGFLLAQFTVPYFSLTER